jgi:hypothetical protein
MRPNTEISKKNDHFFGHGFTKIKLQKFGHRDVNFGVEAMA